ncbi:hypothetical protein V8D89_009384 [Ganoderma adspersum]
MFTGIFYIPTNCQDDQSSIHTWLSSPNRVIIACGASGPTPYRQVPVLPVRHPPHQRAHPLLERRDGSCENVRISKLPRLMQAFERKACAASPMIVTSGVERPERAGVLDRGLVAILDEVERPLVPPGEVLQQEVGSEEMTHDSGWRTQTDLGRERDLDAVDVEEGGGGLRDERADMRVRTIRADEEVECWSPPSPPSSWHLPEGRFNPTMHVEATPERANFKGSYHDASLVSTRPGIPGSGTCDTRTMLCTVPFKLKRALFGGECGWMITLRFPQREREEK